MTLIIRHATEDDIPALTDIFNYHVRNGHATFRPEPETVEQRMQAFRTTATTGPYRMLVAEDNGRILGSAASFRYREGPVFEKTVEFGIYLDPDAMGKGVGSRLYQTLFDYLSTEDVHLAVAGIALPNPGSVALHRKVGFREVGIFDEYAWYRGKFYSSLWMQKRLK